MLILPQENYHKNSSIRKFLLNISDWILHSGYSIVINTIVFTCASHVKSHRRGQNKRKLPLPK